MRRHFPLVDDEFLFQRRTVPVTQYGARYEEQRPGYNHGGHQHLDGVVPVVFGHHSVGVRAAVIAREYTEPLVGRFPRLLRPQAQTVRCRRQSVHQRVVYRRRLQLRYHGRRRRRDLSGATAVPVQFSCLGLIDVFDRGDVLRSHVTVLQGEHSAVDERRVTAAFGVHQEPDDRARPFQQLGTHFIL